MRRIIGNVFVICMVLVILFMSVLLLSYNKYRVTQFGNKTLLIVDSKMLDYEKGSLLVVESVTYEELSAGDYIFYYDTATSPVKTVLVQIKDVVDFDGSSTFEVVLPNDSLVDNNFIIGSTKSTKEYKNVGAVLSVLESKWGNLFLVVVPAFILFMYELFNVILEIKVYNLNSRRR